MNVRQRGLPKTIQLRDRFAVRFWTRELGYGEEVVRTAIRNVGATTDRVIAYLEALSPRDPSHLRPPYNDGRSDGHETAPP